MKKCLILLPVLFLLWGCAKAPPEDSAPPVCRVVTEIAIDCQNGPESLQRRYTSQGKMIKALNYLRRLDPWDPAPPDAEVEQEPLYHITLRFSDGSVKEYRQQSLLYLSTEHGPWMEIDPEYGIRLPLLLAVIPSD